MFYTFLNAPQLLNEFCSFQIEVVKSVTEKEHPLKWSWETVVQGCSFEKVFLKISKNSQENNCAAPGALLKKRFLHVFSCEFCENFQNIFFTEYLRWLLLDLTQRFFRISKRSDFGFLSAMFDISKLEIILRCSLPLVRQ